MKDIKILIAGDFCPIGRTGKAIVEGKSQEMIIGIRKFINQSDFSVINLETPLSLSGTPIEKTGPNIQASPECVEFLTAGGFDLINTANNHIYDYGEESIVETLELLDEKKLRHVGSGLNLREAVKEEVYEIQGRKVAFLAYAENEYTVATKTTAGAAPVDFPVNMKQIMKVSCENDITIVMVHGGNEYSPIPSPGIIKRYRGYIDAGASAVVAMHTHCPQGYEYYEGRPIIYSLGNFLFDTPYPDRKKYEKDDFWWKGYMAALSISADNIISIEAIPVDFGPDGTSVKEIKGSNAVEFLEYLQYISSLIDCDDEVQKYWNAWCMMKGPWWVSHFNNMDYPFDRNDKDKLLSSLALRNGHTCEAHNEIITTFLKLAAHGNDKGYGEYIDRIEKLQKGLLP